MLIHTTAEILNRNCSCHSLDFGALQRLLARDQCAARRSPIAEIPPHMFAGVPVFVAQAHVDAMTGVVAAVEAAVRTPGYRAAALAAAPEVSHRAYGPDGVFYAYDFHLGGDGPKLIEVNTNAGGALLNCLLARAQRMCCSELPELTAQSYLPGEAEEAFVSMFRREWQLQRGAAPLRHVVIVDDAPSSQYLYPEFLLFQSLFRRAGLKASIAAPEELKYDGCLWLGDEQIDLVYNRLTDFYLEGESRASLRDAYLAGAAVVTPHPHGYSLYGDKTHLAWLSDAHRLQRFGVGTDVIAALQRGLPRAMLVSGENRAELWARRKSFFFKPTRGYGSKAAYRGDKLTTRTWAEILDRDYIAQELVRPSERTIEVENARVALKLDIRVYVYGGRAQLMAARLYQGQTTNFRTRGGGFAPVLTVAT